MHDTTPHTSYGTILSPHATKQSLSIFDTIFKHRDAREKHLKAPALPERERYLSHLTKQGLSARFVNERASLLLQVVRIIRIQSKRVDEEEISRAASVWEEEGGSTTNSKRVASFKAVARSWCRFEGTYQSNAVQESSRLPELDSFCLYLRMERGYLPTSVTSCTTTVRAFLRWLSSRQKSLGTVRLADVEGFLEAGALAGWCLRTSTGHARALRVFLKFAETYGVCRLKLSQAIKPLQKGAPVSVGGPTWVQVREMLSLLDCSKPSPCRAKAILLLASVYGLRLSEIVRLSLDDLDWTNQVITITRSKRGRTQQFPLQEEVGEALKRYLTDVRPTTDLRQVFLTLHAPIRPARNIGSAMRKVMSAQNCFDRSWGLHSLRHACATELLRTGTSLRGIADFLGHRGLGSVSIYAHCDCQALRKVGLLNLASVL